jgi:hypothetical protein
MSNIDYIINLCHDIHAQGKKPSVALVRNQSTKPIAIPEVIKALQHWKSNPKQAKKVLIEPEIIATSTLSLEQRVETLEAQLKLVMQELTVLRKQTPGEF